MFDTSSEEVQVDSSGFAHINTQPYPSRVSSRVIGILDVPLTVDLVKLLHCTTMASKHTREQVAIDEDSVFQQLEDYPWETDAEFQSGLQAIVGPNPAPEQAEQLTIRARCFYFSRYTSFLSHTKYMSVC